MGGQEEHGETADQTSEGIKGARALDSIKEPPTSHWDHLGQGSTHLVQGHQYSSCLTHMQPHLGLALCAHP